MDNVAPLIYLAFSETRYDTNSAISFDSPSLLAGMVSMMDFRISSLIAATISVLIYPGQTTFEVIFFIEG